MSKQVTPRVLKKFQEHKFQKRIEAKTKAAGEEIEWSRIRATKDQIIANQITEWRRKHGLDENNTVDELKIIQEVQEFAPGVNDFNTALNMRKWRSQQNRRRARHPQS